MFDFIYENPFDINYDYQDTKAREDYFSKKKSLPNLDIDIKCGYKPNKYIKTKFRIILNNIANRTYTYIPTFKDTYKIPSYEQHQAKVYKTPYYKNWEFRVKGRGFYNPFSTGRGCYQEVFSSLNCWSEAFSSTTAVAEGTSVSN